MNDDKNDQDQKHQQPVENIQEPLVAQNHPLGALDILDRTDNRPDENQHARGVHRAHMLMPGNIARQGLGRRRSSYPQLEDDRGDEEEAEESNLHEETADDDAFACALGRGD